MPGTYKKNKQGIYSLKVLLFLIISTLLANLWINDKPLLIKYNGNLYFPIIFQYSVDEFGIKDQLIVDYSELNQGQFELAIWPLLRTNPNKSDLTLDSYPAPPSSQHLLGTDDRGRDLLVRLIYGFRNTLLFTFSCLFFSYLIGIFMGTLMGYFGGWFDTIGMRVVELIESIPSLFIVLILISIFEPGIYLLGIYLSLMSWVKIATQIRSQMLRLKKQEFIQSARVIGLSHLQIIIKHLLPNSLSVLITMMPFSIIYFIVFLTFVDFLGMGLPPPAPSLGELFQQAQVHFLISPWLFWYPTLFLVMVLGLLTRVGRLIDR